MKLLSIAASNYRVHKDIAISLDASRTVIGGPNESGKSTLMEAAHRALFMRYKTGGDVQSEMISHAGGQPTVTVDFEVDGKRYQISKRFSGQTGTAVLTQEGAPTLKNEEAESRLAALLGVDVAAGKGSRMQWAHLWVWQGCAFEDPTDSANSQVGNLLDQFQKSGAAVTTQSLIDGKVATKFQSMQAEYYTKQGVKKNSPLAAAIDRHERALLSLAQAEAAREKLYVAASDLETAQQALKEVAASLLLAESDAKDMSHRREQLTTHSSTQQLQQHKHSTALQELERRQDAESQIVELRGMLAQLHEGNAPLSARAAELTTHVAAAKTRAADTAAQVDAAGDRLRALRLHTTLSGLFERRFQLFAERSALAAREAEIAGLQAERHEILTGIAKLPAVSTEQLEQLTSAQQRYAMAEASLSAMAAGVELLTSTTEVRLDETVLRTGERFVVTAESTLALGDSVRLKITPGGGASLSDARQQMDEAQRDFSSALDVLGVSSLAQARYARDQLMAFAAQQQQLELRLAELGVNTVADDRAALEQSVSVLDADIERREALAGEHPIPGTLAQAVEQHRLLAAKLETTEAQEKQLLELRQAANDEAAQADVEREQHANSLKHQQEELRECETALAGLTSVHGDDQQRLQVLEQHTHSVASCEAALTATRTLIADLQPELLELDEHRSARVRKGLAESRTANEQIIMLSRHVLSQDGSRDPHAELAAAADVEQDARDARVRIELHAKAIDLLNRHFAAEQEQVASQFAVPLREKVTGYLRCLYGPHSNVQLNYDGDALSGLGLERRGEIDGTFEFSALSGGAREQLAAALRLGVAEVLAAGHNGSLPVVFDDAFAYSDPQRMDGLQRMLDLAAVRGLQIIVLTCNPRDYDRFGAKQVVLKSVSRVLPRDAGSEPVVLQNGGSNDSGDSAAPMVTSAKTSVGDRLAKEFLTLLSAKGGKAGAQTLRSELGWEGAVFDKVKQSLRGAQEITIGRGRGGSIALAGVSEG